MVNQVSLIGKVSRVGRLAYTPAGVAISEFTLAVPQTYFDKETIGYYEIVMVGKEAEELVGRVKIGRMLTLKGRLWTRSFRNRQGIKMTETKILVSHLS